MTVKTIVCDLDGVLIWHHPSDPAKDWRKELVFSDMLLAWEAFQASLDWELCLRNSDIDTRTRFLSFLSKRGCRPDHEAHAVIDLWLKHNIEPCEQALRKIEEWRGKGFECAVASNQDGTRKPYIESWLEEHGLGDLPRFISCDLHYAKPDTGYFKHVQNALNRAPEELLLIDDDEENIEAAQKAGWMTFLIDASYRLNPEKWDSVRLFHTS